MTRGTNQKFKFYYTMKIMLEMTDEEHSITVPQIIKELEQYEITAERKSIYEDLHDMERFGIEVMKEQIGRQTFYHVSAREFELPEAKLLIDAIQSSKFITRTKSRELIQKIKGFVSKYQARQLQRQVFIANRVKTMNESVYYNVDEIHNAINQNKKISFEYFKWDVNKKLVPRHDGLPICVSPWALTWDDENYYLVAYDDFDKKIKHYRVDKMMHIEVINEMREGKELFKGFDMARYSRATFGMYGGEERTVRILTENSLCGVFIDRFGKDIIFSPVDDDHSEFFVKVNVSPQFFGWIFSLGTGVKLLSPDDVVADMKTAARKFLEMY